jgi:RsiW-degrading membrane proteinase PrsW (M82 family)
MRVSGTASRPGIGKAANRRRRPVTVLLKYRLHTDAVTSDDRSPIMVQVVHTSHSATQVRRVWLRMFLTGLALWTAAIVIILMTGNANLIPTVVLLGSFLVPVTFVVWAFERRETGEITAGLVFSTFVTGGVLGVLGASVLESYLLHPSPWLFFGVALIEEAVKLGALMMLTRHLRTRTLRDGMILGAAVGFGFAAFESAGYAFVALFSVDGLSLVQLVQTEVLRGVLAPVGHGLWTAILGGVLFAASGQKHFRITAKVVLTYLGVSILHGLWDSMHSIALYLTLVLTEGEQYAATPQGWLVEPSAEQVNIFTAMQWGGLALVSIVGIGWLLVLWSRTPRPVRTTWATARSPGVPTLGP